MTTFGWQTGQPTIRTLASIPSKWLNSRMANVSARKRAAASGDDRAMWSVLAICLPGLAQNRTILRKTHEANTAKPRPDRVKYDRVNYGRDPQPRRSPRPDRESQLRPRTSPLEQLRTNRGNRP
jgi:hypothetical protein